MVVASGQSIERTEAVTPVDLMARASRRGLGRRPGLRHRIDRVSVVNIMSRSGPAPATELARRHRGPTRRLRGRRPSAATAPQWLVNRAAGDIAAGALSVTLIAGAEAIRSSRARRAAGHAPGRRARPTCPPDPVVGDDLPGVGPAEVGHRPVGARCTSTPCSRAWWRPGPAATAPEHRQAMGELLAPFTEVAAANPYAWFRQARSAADIAIPTPDNRIVCEPYTKRMCAFLGSDQGAALIVCSLAAARRAGVADRAVFIWSGAEATDVRFPTARPDPGRSPGHRRRRARAALGRRLVGCRTGARGARDRRHRGARHLLVLPLGRRVGRRRAGHRPRRPTGADGHRRSPLLRRTGQQLHHPRHRHGDRPCCGTLPGPGGGRAGIRLGMATGLGWFITKHAIGIYGSEPPPAGFHRGDTRGPDRPSTPVRWRWRSRSTNRPGPPSSPPP